MPWDESRLHAVELAAAECPDACSEDVISLCQEVRRLRTVALTAFDVIEADLGKLLALTRTEQKVETAVKLARKAMED